MSQFLRGDSDQMNYLNRTFLASHALATVVGVGSFWMDAFAQEAQESATAAAGASKRSVQERVKIQPYTGPPIYLEELEEVAEAKIVDRDVVNEEYEGGSPRVQRQVARFSDDHFEADGYYREFYPNGKPFVQGEFRRGRQHGEWTYSFDNGQLNRKATYNNGQPDGAWEVYRADGTLFAKRGFREGMRHGEWITYDATGKQPLREERYDNGKADGVWKFWYPNGQQRQEINFKQGKKNGVNREWTEKGEKRGEVSYLDDKLDGTTTVWLADGRKVVQQYKAGRLISESKE
jgi:antitoxin component YwqK of YwqJK toxin-antitoxin module